MTAPLVLRPAWSPPYDHASHALRQECPAGHGPVVASGAHLVAVVDGAPAGVACGACARRSLREGTAVLEDEAAVRGELSAARARLAAGSGTGQDRLVSEHLAAVLEAWDKRGEKEAEALLRAVGYLRRQGRLEELGDVLAQAPKAAPEVLPAQARRRRRSAA